MKKTQIDLSKSDKIFILLILAAKIEKLFLKNLDTFKSKILKVNFQIAHML